MPSASWTFSEGPAARQGMSYVSEEFSYNLCVISLRRSL